MQQQIQERLQQLQAEFAEGQKVLVDLETKQANVHQTLLRISGAMQVLEELLAPSESTPEHLNGVPLNSNVDNLEPTPSILSNG
jgi:hypothetical protein